MFPRFGAALAAFVLAFAPAGPGTAPANAGGDVCAMYDCYTVAIAATGNGSGRVQSTNAQFVPDGIMDCPMVRGIVDTTKCSHKYPDMVDAGGVVVYILATPAAGSQLCDENGCRTEPFQRSRFFTQSGTFAETFSLLVFDVNLATAGTGSGRITSEPPYLDCPTECETSLEAGEQLVFTAKAAAGSKFSKWTGGCAGQNATCEITLMADLTTSATFTKLATAAPTAEPTEPTESAAPSPTAEASAIPTTAPTILPTVVPATPEPSLDPGPSSDDGGSGPIVLLMAVLLAGLLVALGVVLVRARRPAAS